MAVQQGPNERGPGAYLMVREDAERLRTLLADFLGLLLGLALVFIVWRSEPALAQQLQVDVRPLTSTVDTPAYSRGSSLRRTPDIRPNPRRGDSDVFVVEVEISNNSDRVYVLETDKIALRSETGARVKPLAEEDTESPAPRLTSQTVAPGTSVTGYLGFPPGTYTGAAGYLIEQQSQAREGFSVHF